ncbi:LuxR family transcriptional regulator [Holdemanella biformis]|uniref:LuxR family transcriptional regulator n=2 Tax=Holdemanella biformis TaxID=1735 RepID=A0A413CU01_9FIRM|nr:LuxR family transcriptional regulator [Holdemanella biformis]
MQENRKKLQQIENEHEAIQKEYDRAKKEVERLTTKRIDDIDEDEYKRFLECLATLTRKEKEILNLYVKGYSSKDILETLNITDNTLKYHNRNIYSKLGVKSRKQLLMYMTLLNNKRS